MYSLSPAGIYRGLAIADTTTFCCVDAGNTGICISVSVLLEVIVAFITAAHPWLRDESCNVPLDILIFKLVKSYVRATPLKRAALMVITHQAITYWLIWKLFETGCL